MKEIAEEIGFKIVYEDTDSLFLHYEDNETDLSRYAEESLSKFKKECPKQVGIEVEQATKYKTAIIRIRSITFFYKQKLKLYGASLVFALSLNSEGLISIFYLVQR